MPKPFITGITIRKPDGTPFHQLGFNIDERFGASDIQWIKSKGYNYVRILFPWHRIEPSEGSYNWTSLDNILSACQQNGIYANICFMQWHWSPYFTFDAAGGGIGFPAWLISAGGYANSAPGRQAAMDDFYLKRGYGAVAWQKFVQFWSTIVSRYKDNPYVAFYEIINEPMVGAAHVDEARIACNDRYREIVPIMRAIDPETIIFCHYIDYGFNQLVNFPNIAWTRSYYKYEGVTRSAIDTVLNALKAEFNVGMGVPFIISEIGVQPADQSIADSFLTTLFYEQWLILNDGVRGWAYYQYALGTRGGYQGPRNSDGSDSWVHTILAKQLTENPPPPPPDVIAHTLTINSTPIRGFPFTLNGAAQVTDFSAVLDEREYTIVMPLNVQPGGVGTDIYNFLQWNDGTTNPVKTINLISDLVLQAIYGLATPPNPAKGRLNIHAFMNDVEIGATLLIIETSESFVTPAMLEMSPGQYTLKSKYLTYEQVKTVEVIEGQTLRVDFNFQTAPTLPQAPWIPIAIGTGLILISP